jgi:putative flavoprotein involved in K+ transport
MRIHTVVIGGGQAGLAMSAGLAAHGIEHIVIERGRVANVWCTERWDSFRLLSPNWMTRLPGFAYDGTDPDGFMTGSEVVSHFEEYASLIAAPVVEHTTVRSVRRRTDVFEVMTDRGTWLADAVVVATGDAMQPRVPRMALRIDRDIRQITPATYKRPDQLPDGAVLVVGASASGAQLASEIQSSGRDVVVAVGGHVRMPRRYRGADIMTWLDRAGVFDDLASDVRDIRAARRQPSMQLVGSAPARDLDLNTLQRDGVRLAGRLIGADGHHVAFADDLRDTVGESEAKLHGVLERVDPVADAMHAPRDEFPASVQVPASPTYLDMRAERIGSVLWTTGYRRSYPWLQVPVLDARGNVRQHEGVTDVPGLYTIGLRFQRARKSHFIDGVGDDALILARHIATKHRVRVAA